MACRDYSCVPLALLRSIGFQPVSECSGVEIEDAG